MDGIALANAVGRTLATELGDAMVLVEHCVGQLDDAQVWRRVAEDRNAVGNLLLHMAGNVRQRIVAGLAGAEDRRDRPAEFAERRPIAKEELLAGLRATVRTARAVLASRGPEDWLRERSVGGFPAASGLAIAIRSVCHFHGHAQEIVRMTRDMLGERYAMAEDARQGV